MQFISTLVHHKIASRYSRHKNGWNINEKNTGILFLTAIIRVTVFGHNLHVGPCSCPTAAVRCLLRIEPTRQWRQSAAACTPCSDVNGQIPDGRLCRVSVYTAHCLRFRLWTSVPSTAAHLADLPAVAYTPETMAYNAGEYVLTFPVDSYKCEELATILKVDVCCTKSVVVSVVWRNFNEYTIILVSVHFHKPSMLFGCYKLTVIATKRVS